MTRIPVLKNLAMPPRLFWAAQTFALGNMALWALVMIYGLAMLGVSPLAGILGFWLTHFILIVATKREPHLDAVLAGLRFRLRGSATAPLTFAEDGKTLLSGTQSRAALLQFTPLVPDESAQVDAFTKCLHQLAQQNRVTLRLITSTFQQQAASGLLVITNKGQQQLEQTVQHMQDNLPGYRFIWLDRQSGGRFLAKCLNPVVSFQGAGDALPIPKQQGKILTFSSPSKTLYASALTPRDLSYLDGTPFLGHLLRTYPDLIAIQSVDPMSASRAAFTVAQQQKLSQRFSPQTSEEYLRALDLIESEQHTLCRYICAVIVFAPSPELLQGRIEQIQRHASAQTANLTPERGAALAAWGMLLADDRLWARSFKLFDEQIAPQLVAATMPQ